VQCRNASQITGVRPVIPYFEILYDIRERWYGICAFKSLVYVDSYRRLHCCRKEISQESARSTKAFFSPPIKRSGRPDLLTDYARQYLAVQLLTRVPAPLETRTLKIDQQPCRGA
jgi:hypothetical protein